MELVVAGVLSGMIAWLGNEWLIKIYGHRFSVVWLVPLLEECAKTILAICLGASILYTHVFFGVLEGILDIRNSEHGLEAAIYSVITHSVFGALTMGIFHFTNSIFWCILISSVIHMGWNWHIIRKENI